MIVIAKTYLCFLGKPDGLARFGLRLSRCSGRGLFLKPASDNENKSDNNNNNEELHRYTMSKHRRLQSTLKCKDLCMTSVLKRVIRLAVTHYRNYSAHESSHGYRSRKMRHIHSRGKQRKSLAEKNSTKSKHGKTTERTNTVTSTEARQEQPRSGEQTKPNQTKREWR